MPERTGSSDVETDHSTPLPARQGGLGDDGDVPFIHLRPDGRGHLPQADPPWSSNHRLERARGGSVDGQPHGWRVVDPYRWVT